MKFLLAILLFALLQWYASADELQCFTDEPRIYHFDIGAQKVGSWQLEVKHVTGKLAGTTHKFRVHDVETFKEYDAYLIKRYTVGQPYTVTYAMECKRVKTKGAKPIDTTR